MKKFLAITTSLAAAVCALSLGGAAAAFAETDDTGEEIAAERFYPTDFTITPTFDSLDDYAVGNGEYLFLENSGGSVIYEYANDSVTVHDEIRRDVTALYFEGEEFYYRTDDGKIYALKNIGGTDNAEITDFNSTTETDRITLGNYLYYLDTNNELQVLNTGTNTIEPLEGFSNMKKYGETVYAVKENILYTLNGTDYAEVKVENFKIAENIAVGDTYSVLTSSATSDLQFVSLKSGAYMTKVELDKLTSNSITFSVVGTEKVSTANTPAALLIYTYSDGEDGISIISIGTESYLIHPKDTSPIKIYLPEDLSKEGTATSGGSVYSVPFESDGTRIGIVSGSVTVLKEIKASEFPELDGDFYLIQYEDGDTTVRGYVRYGLIPPYTFNEDPPVSTPDPDATTEDLIKPVVLILLVLLLIAIAAGYLIYVGTSDKRNKKTDGSSSNKNKKN